MAIDLPNVQKQLFARMQSRLKPVYQAGSFAEPENMHITLHFLGDTAVSKLPGLIDQFNQIEMPQLELGVGKLISFPDDTKARVSAVELKGDVTLLSDLYDRMGKILKQSGFRLDHRKYRPHITLTRFKFPMNPAKLEEGRRVVASLIDSAPTFRTGQFTLFQSTLDSSGARYAALGKFPKKVLSAVK